MLDSHLRPTIDRLLARTAHALAARGVSANFLTASGLVAGVLAAVFIVFGAFVPAIVLALTSRVLDGLDGAVARETTPNPLGGYFDILADFIFYAALPLGFALYNPAANALSAAVLLASFFMNAASFLGFAIVAEQQGRTTDVNGKKSHYHATGLIEGTETIAFFAICLIFPDAFASLALVFAALTTWTFVQRTYCAWRLFGG